MSIITMRKLLISGAMALTTITSATAQQGPVASACAVEMEKLCAGKSHAQREMRNCLEANKDKVSAPCKTALETTGPGKGTGANKPN
ncbi:MAG: hypothetical protein ABL897_09885 [Hyphomicrobium sp.]